MTYNLERFVSAHKNDYETALSEIESGRKQSHWMWYIFPQIKELGISPMSEYYGIKDIEEAKAYLQNEYLRNHLVEISEALLKVDSDDPEFVMGYPDDLKLQSSMTLFLIADPSCDIFQKVLDKYYNGETDAQTLSIIDESDSENCTDK